MEKVFKEIQKVMNLEYVYSQELNPSLGKLKEGIRLVWAGDKGFGQIDIFDPDPYTQVIVDDEMIGYEHVLEIIGFWFSKGKPKIPEDYYEEMNKQFE